MFFTLIPATMTSADKLSIMQSPMCLIETDSENKLQVNENALAEVEKLEGALVVVGIAGLYRTGKSYLMNRLALPMVVETSTGTDAAVNSTSDEGNRHVLKSQFLNTLHSNI